MESENPVEEIDRILQDATGISEPIALANHLISALSTAYSLSLPQIQQLSSGMYGKTVLFRLLSSENEIEAHEVVCLRLLYFILQTSMTCSDFVLSNVLFVEKLLDQIKIDSPQYVNFIKGDQPPLGTFFDSSEPLPFNGFTGCTQLIDAKIAVLEVISRCSAEGRMIILKHEAALLEILHGFSVLEIFAPMRICGILQVILHILLFEGCKKCDKYLDAVRSAALKLFSGNKLTIEELAEQTHGKAPERSACMVFNTDGRTLFKSDELYQTKCVLLVVFQKLRELKAGEK